MKADDFGQRLAELQPALYLFTRKFTRSREDSYDLVQETVAKAWRQRTSFKENKNLIGWLYIIMRNTFINQYRKDSQVKSMLQNDWHFKSNYDQNATRADEPAHLDEVWKAIDMINPELSKPLTMHVSGYKYEEIALALDIPIGTVKSRIFLARQNVRNQLPGYC